MLFNSLAFLVFFPVVTTLYFALPGKARPAMLLAASCWFYMAFIPAYILFLGATIFVDYWVGILLARAENPRLRRSVLGASLIANVGALAVFKYYNLDWQGETLRGINPVDLIALLAATPILLLIENPNAPTNPLDAFRTRPTWLRWGLRYAVLFIILHLGQFTSTQFIYFQF